MYISKRRDYAWNTAAGVINAAEAVIMSMIVTRFGKLSDAGILSISFAVGNVLMTIGIFGVRMFQASDIKSQYSFGSYIKLRLVTLGMMTAALAAFLFAAGYDRSKAASVALIAFIYMVETLESCIWGHFQSKDLLYVGARMFVTRWLLVIIAFSACMVMTGDMVSSLICASCAGLCVFAIWLVALRKDMRDDSPAVFAGKGSTFPAEEASGPIAEEALGAETSTFPAEEASGSIAEEALGAEGSTFPAEEASDPIAEEALGAEGSTSIYGGERIGSLMWQVFPLFAAEFCSMFIINIPKFAIDRYLNDAVQACYGFVAMPVFVIGLLNQFIYQPKIVGLTNLYHEGDITQFRQNVRRQIFLVALITFACVVGAAAIGIPVLSLIYHTDLSAYWMELVILQFGGGFLALTGYLYVILTIIRRQKVILGGYVAALIAGIVILFSAVKYAGTIGAAVGYLILMALLFIYYFIAYEKIIKEPRVYPE